MCGFRPNPHRYVRTNDINPHKSPVCVGRGCCFSTIKTTLAPRILYNTLYPLYIILYILYIILAILLTDEDVEARINLIGSFSLETSHPHPLLRCLRLIYNGRFVQAPIWRGCAGPGGAPTGVLGRDQFGKETAPGSEGWYDRSKGENHTRHAKFSRNRLPCLGPGTYYGHTAFAQGENLSSLLERLAEHPMTSMLLLEESKTMPIEAKKSQLNRR